jgi:hypothetical protein
MIRNIDPFPLGMVVATPGALAELARTAEPASKFLNRHSKGDWGTVCPEDWKTNDDALLHGARLVSAYKLNDGTVIWVITESDRSVTRILLPQEY